MQEIKVFFSNLAFRKKARTEVTDDFYFIKVKQPIICLMNLLICSWRSQSIIDQDQSTLASLVQQPVLENTLIELPEDFSELINTAANFRYYPL